MKLRAIRCRDFMQFEDVDLDMTDAGPVIGVRGVYAGDPRKSNRSGKSSLVYDLPLFVLSGWSRTGTLADVVRRGCAEGWAEIEVEGTGGSVLRVRRTQRGRTTLPVEIDGVEMPLDPAKERIESFLGLPVSDLRNVSLFEQGDVLGFLAGDQRRILARWLDQGHWERAAVAAGTRLREAEAAETRADDAVRAAEAARDGMAALEGALAAAVSLATRAEAEVAAMQDAMRCEAEAAAADAADRAFRTAVAASTAATAEAKSVYNSAVASADAGLAQAKTRHGVALAAAERVKDEAEAASTDRCTAAKRALDAAVDAAVADARETSRRARLAADEAAGVRRLKNGALVQSKSRAATAATELAGAERKVLRAEETKAKRQTELERVLAAASVTDSACHVTGKAPCSELRDSRAADGRKHGEDAFAALATATADAEGAAAAIAAARAEVASAALLVAEAESAVTSAVDVQEVLEAEANACAGLLESAGTSAAAKERAAYALALKAHKVVQTEAEAVRAEAEAVADDELAVAKRAREESIAAAALSRDGRISEALLAERRALQETQAASAALRLAKAAHDPAALVRLQQAAGDARRSRTEAEISIEAARKAVDDLDARVTAASLSYRKVRALRIVRAAFGRDGIPARVTEGHLDALADDANEFLARLGAEPRVEWRTWRELQRWQEACHACGCAERTGRGESLRCAECGARWRKARAEDFACVLRYGRHEATLESDSGGGKTLVALAVRFALSRLVSRARGVEVDMLVMDEPFAALDVPNLRSAVGLVTDVLGAYGVRQVILVSHVPEVQDAVSDLITVVREGDTSRVEATWSK